MVVGNQPIRSLNLGETTEEKIRMVRIELVGVQDHLDEPSESKLVNEER